MQKLLTAAAVFLLFVVPVLAQKKTPPPAAQLLTRTLTRHEVRRFGYGGTVTVVGAPQGSIIVEGWSKNEVDLTADIQVQGATEDDMARLAAVTGFVFDDDSNHLSLITTGIHDKAYLRKVDKKFPKTLLSMPWKIDYHLKVPIDTDLEINGGTTVINVDGVEGALRVNAPQARVDLSLTGRTANVIVGGGTINFLVSARSWRGSGVDVQLAAGELNVQLPAGFSGDIDADILRTGKVVNDYGVEARERLSVNEKSVHGRAGAGGAYLKFTVGDGQIHIIKAP
jgi:hypothetical protein